VLEDAADGRPSHEKTASPSGMGAGGREEARTKPRRRGRRKQAGAHHLGHLNARRAVQAAVRHSEHSDKRSCLKRTRDRKPVRAFPPTNAKDATDEVQAERLSPPRSRSAAGLLRSERGSRDRRSRRLAWRRRWYRQYSRFNTRTPVRLTQRHADHTAEVFLKPPAR
jgi:hypothetical protein